jgi:hypothetical protein
LLTSTATRESKAKKLKVSRITRTHMDNKKGWTVLKQ